MKKQKLGTAAIDDLGSDQVAYGSSDPSSGVRTGGFRGSNPPIDDWKKSDVGTAALLSSAATSAAVFSAAVAEAPLFFSTNSEKRQRRFF